MFSFQGTGIPTIQTKTKAHAMRERSDFVLGLFLKLPVSENKNIANAIS